MADAPPHPRTSLAKRLAEYFSLATVASFALSILANQLVFDRWGLNFLQTATVADVVMSGLSLLLYTLPLAMVFLAAWWAGGFRGALRWLLIVPVVLGVLFVFAGGWGLAMGKGGPGAPAALSLGGAMLGGLVIQPALRLRSRRRLASFILLTAVAAWLLFSLTQFVAYTIGKYEFGGYAPSAPLRLVTPSLPNCAGHVLWMGERALVLHCGDRQSGQAIRVVHSPENWVFAAETRAPADAESQPE